MTTLHLPKEGTTSFLAVFKRNSANQKKKTEKLLIVFKNATGTKMQPTSKIKEAGATGYILLWLLGIPIPILLLIFLLRGCT
jgi:hypothetical protein